MPFTFSHPAAALLVRRGIRRGWLPLAPFVVGAMAPDFEYVLRLEPWARVGHLWPGLATYTFPLAVIVLAWWEWMGADAVRPLVAVAPGAPRGDAAWWGRALVAVAIGIVTHVAWDAFTHWDGWGVSLFPVLGSSASSRFPRLTWANVLQHASTLAGGTVVVVWYIRQLHAAAGARALVAPWRQRVFVAVGAVTVAIALWNAPRAGTMTDVWHVKIVAGRLIVGAMAGLAGALVAYSAWWRTSSQRRQRDPVAHDAA